MGGQRPPAPRRRLLLRHQRHQRPRDPGGGARGRQAEAGAAERPSGSLASGPIPLAPLGQGRAGPGRGQAERLAAHLAREPRARPDRRRLLAGSPPAPRFEHRAVVLGEDREELLGGARGPRRRRALAQRVTARAKPERQARLPLHRPGLPAARHGQGAATRPTPPSREAFDAALRRSSTRTSSAPLAGARLRQARHSRGRAARRHHLRPARPLRDRGRPVRACCESAA